MGNCSRADHQAIRIENHAWPDLVDKDPVHSIAGISQIDRVFDICPIKAPEKHVVHGPGPRRTPHFQPRPSHGPTTPDDAGIAEHVIPVKVGQYDPLKLDQIEARSEHLSGYGISAVHK